MDAKPILVGNWCFVCGDELEPSGRSVQETSSCSDKQLIKFIETFTGIELGENLLAESPQAEVCQKCIERIEEYDRICLRAAEIHEEISELFGHNQTRRYDELHCNTCQTQFLSQDEMSNHECLDESTYLDELFDECDDEVDESTEETKKAPTKERRPNETINYLCNTCGKDFDKRRAYQNHIKLAHLPEYSEVYNCTECSTDVFVSKRSLELHMAISHPEDPNCTTFKCPVCLKSFVTKSLLTRHFGIHDNQRPHFCEICGKTFYHYSSFYAHAKLHADIRDFKCSQCDKAFRSQSHLTRHLKSHTKTKNHECPECGTRFAERYNLTVHLNAHFGIVRKNRKPQKV